MTWEYKITVQLYAWSEKKYIWFTNNNNYGISFWNIIDFTICIFIVFYYRIKKINDMRTQRFFCVLHFYVYHRFITLNVNHIISFWFDNVCNLNKQSFCVLMVLDRRGKNALRKLSQLQLICIYYIVSMMIIAINSCIYIYMYNVIIYFVYLFFYEIMGPLKNVHVETQNI